MRLSFVRTLLVLALLGNVIIWHRIWRLFAAQNTLGLLTPGALTNDPPLKFHRRLSRLVTIIIRQFENFENDVVTTIESVLNSFPSISILIVCDELPYPPLELHFGNETLQNVKLITLQTDFNKTYEERNPMFYIRTKYVLFLPDASRISTRQTIQKAIVQTSEFKIVTIPVGKVTLSCLNVNLKIKEWSLQFAYSSNVECDFVIGKHATILEAKILRKLSDPFLLPFPDGLYMQTAAIGAKIHILKDHRFSEGKPLYRNQQIQWKVEQLYKSRERLMFKQLGIKKVTRASTLIEWYGCSRETSRCFGSVINGIPSYLYQNRYTPPCCLAALRKVAHHAFDKLEEVGIRFWLEGTSLLGAMRNGDILPWDHEVQIGINKFDLERSQWLVKAKIKSIVDNHGFVWEKATEGEFFKVHYSKINNLHVNLLPFYPKNGSMVKDAWFMQNDDFPEQYLHPMSTIEFAGRQVPCPNNIRDFLELKYFKGVVDNPKLPGELTLEDISAKQKLIVMEDSGIDSDPKIITHNEDEKLFLGSDSSCNSTQTQISQRSSTKQWQKKLEAHIEQAKRIQHNSEYTKLPKRETSKTNMCSNNTNGLMAIQRLPIPCKNKENLPLVEYWHSGSESDDETTLFSLSKGKESLKHKQELTDTFSIEDLSEESEDSLNLDPTQPSHTFAWTYTPSGCFACHCQIL